MNLVVAMSGFYNAATLQNFVRSFTRHTRGEILLLLQNTDEETKAWLRRMRVPVIEVETYLHPKFSRYYAMHELAARHEEYSRIFHSDVRDAVAQGDIFTQIPEPGLHVFCEDPLETLGTCQANSAWLEHAYGKEMVARYRDKPIICSGTTLGDRESFIVYTKAMVDEYERLLETSPPAKVVYLVHDQTIHNHLIYSGILEEKLAAAGRELHCHPNGHGVLTMGYVARFHVSPQGTITTVDRESPAVLHQYDRIPALKELLDTRYTE